MPVSAATLEKLMAAGLAGDALLDVVRSIDADNVKATSQDAIRQKRYRDKKRDEHNECDVTRDVTNVTQRSPQSPPNPSPTPPSNTPPISPHSVSNETGADAPPDPIKQVFDLGVALLTQSGCDGRAARSMIGKWRRDHGDGRVFEGLTEARARAVSQPVEWMTKWLRARSQSPAADELAMPC